MAGGKRKYGEEPSEKLYSNKSRSRPSVEARVDPTYGQRSAIPGLDDDTTVEGQEEWLNYDEDMDALAYLRSVRQEATAIPNLLVAPKEQGEKYERHTYQDGDSNPGGYYEDGAYYTSDPVHTSGDDVIEEGDVGMDPQLAYFDSILARFEILREQLLQLPPAEIVKKLGQDHPTHVGRLDVKVSKWWRWHMRTTVPLPAQIASMDKSTVLRLLGLLTGGALLKKGSAVNVGVSRWAWGLLARLPERGLLNSEEIGVVRELGKKAVLVGMGLREDKQWEEGINEVQAGYEDDDDYEEGEAYVNREEIQLDIDEDLDDIELSTMTPLANGSARQIGPQLPPPMTNNAISIQDGNTTKSKTASIPNGSTENGDLDQEEEGKVSTQDTQLADELAAAKARILAGLEENAKADLIQQNALEDVPRGGDKETPDDPDDMKWNTKATVDMIITVAGEMFGQRDLLEFRSVWGNVL